MLTFYREVKRKFQPRYPGVAYIPDRLVVVVLSAILCYTLDWEAHGVAIMGDIKAASGHVFTFRWPFQLSHMDHIRDAMGTSFLIALLGFFESSVAAKSLGPSKELPGIQLSPNRELVALGTANLIGSCFMSMPAFGGYGRSKVNKQTGGKTPMSSIFLSCLAVICIFFVLPYFYYLPVRYFPRNLPHHLIADQIIEARPFLPHYCRCLVSCGRSTSRRSFLPPHRRLA